MKQKVLLAFSGGLDTSFCAMYLAKEKKYEVHTAVANTGGFSEEELNIIEDKAYRLGAKTHTTLDVTQEYYDRIHGLWKRASQWHLSYFSKF